MMKNAAPHKGRAVTVILSILAILLAAAAVLSWMALNDPNAGKGLESVAPSDKLAKDAAASAITGKECSFSVDEVNGYLAYLFRKSDAAKKGGNVKIESIAVSGAIGNSADLYLPVRYLGRHLGVVLNVTPALDTEKNRLLFRVNSARVGRLPLPPDWILSKAENHLPEGATREGGSITCPAPSIEANAAGISASLRLGNFRMYNGFLEIGVSVKAGLSQG